MKVSAQLVQCFADLEQIHRPGNESADFGMRCGRKVLARVSYFLEQLFTGPTSAICLWNSGITLPDEPSTLPKRTAMNFVRVGCAEYRACTYISARRLVAPMTLVGLMALSVEIRMKRSTPNSRARSASWAVPRLLFLMASPG